MKRDVDAHGTTLVSVVQPGRFYDGDAPDIGFSTSKDGRKPWRGTLDKALTAVAAVVYPSGNTATAQTRVAAALRDR